MAIINDPHGPQSFNVVVKLLYHSGEKCQDSSHVMTPQTIEFQVFLRSTATLPYPSDIPFDKFIPSPASPGSFTVLTEKKLMAVTAHQVALVPELCTVSSMLQPVMIAHREGAPSCRVLQASKPRAASPILSLRYPHSHRLGTKSPISKFAFYTRDEFWIPTSSVI